MTEMKSLPQNLADLTAQQIAETSKDRNATIALLRTILKARSGKPWSVKGDRGSAWGWITISSPPARAADQWGSMIPEEAAELGALLGMDQPVHHQGQNIPASSKHRHVIIELALGRTPTVTAEQYWD